MFELAEPRAPAFIGLWEAIAWVGLRDEEFSSRVRSNVTEWLAQGHQQKLLPLDIIDGLGMPIGDAFERLADLCRTGELGAKGKAHDGFRDITCNEWHELSLIGADGPDALGGPRFLAGLGEADTGWRLVRFKRSEVERLFPPLVEALASVRTGDPGRPSKGNELYMSEFRRRVEEGRVRAILSEEAADLHAWFRENHPLQQLPSQKTIGNRIRDAHRATKIS